MKTIFISILVIASTFLIYIAKLDRKVYYLNLSINDNYSDYVNKKLSTKLERYVSGYTNKDYRTTDLLNDIINNKRIKEKNKNISIKNALIKADLITLRIGDNDIKYKILTGYDDLYDYADSMINDLEKLIKIIREYSKENIIFIGLKNTFGYQYTEIIHYINEKIKEICEENKVNFVNPNLKKSIKKQIFACIN